MYIRRGPEANVPPGLYRSPREIRADMERISSEIEKTSEAVNVRSLLLEILADNRKREPERLIPELYRAIEEADAALASLKELKEELTLLNNELSESICRLRV